MARGFMEYKIYFINPARNYQMIMDEIDAAYFEVMSKGGLIDSGQLKSLEENLMAFVGTKSAVGLNKRIQCYPYVTRDHHVRPR